MAAVVTPPAWGWRDDSAAEVSVPAWAATAGFVGREAEQSAMARLLSRSAAGDAGFALVRVRNLSGGIAAIHSGWRL